MVGWNEVCPGRRGAEAAAGVGLYEGMWSISGTVMIVLLGLCVLFCTHNQQPWKNWANILLRQKVTPEERRSPRNHVSSIRGKCTSTSLRKWLFLLALITHGQRSPKSSLYVSSLSCAFSIATQTCSHLFSQLRQVAIFPHNVVSLQSNLCLHLLPHSCLWELSSVLLALPAVRADAEQGITRKGAQVCWRPPDTEPLTRWVITATWGSPLNPNLFLGKMEISITTSPEVCYEVYSYWTLS